MQTKRITAKPRPKIRKCKVCRSDYVREKLDQKVCGYQCGLALHRTRQKAAEERRRLKARREHREQKQAIKTRQQWLHEAQQAFNAYIRLRDHDKPCISCDRAEGKDNLTGGYWHAGHYRTTAAQPSMRFNEINCHKQCPTCNNHKSGNQIEYRIGLVNRIGPELVGWLDRDHPQPSKWTIEEIKTIRDYYRGAVKAIRQYMAGYGNV